MTYDRATAARPGCVACGNPARGAGGQARATEGLLRMCPGVGKTYTMLEAAGAQGGGCGRRGGVVETHGRAETEALLAGLRSFRASRSNTAASRCRKWTSTPFSRGVRNSRWWTNCPHEAPESRHPKRYQDVLELLDAGSTCTPRSTCSTSKAVWTSYSKFPAWRSRGRARFRARPGR